MYKLYSITHWKIRKVAIKDTLEYYKEMRSSLNEMIPRIYITSDISYKL